MSKFRCAASLFARLIRLRGLRSCVPLGKSHPCRSAIPELEPLLGYHLHPDSLARALRLEIRSLSGRIGEMLKTKLHRRGVLVPRPRLEKFPFLVESPTTKHEYIRDMQGVLAYRPWMSTSDVLSFALAWTLGYESCARTHCMKSSLSERQASQDFLPKQTSEDCGQITEVNPAVIAGITRKPECARHEL